MGRDRVQLLACAVISIALIVVGALAIDWFGDGSTIRVGLRTTRVCTGGHCNYVPRSALGAYGTLSPITLFAALATAIFVGVQTAARLATDHTIRRVSQIGTALAIVALGLVLVTAFAVAPLGLAERSGAPMLVLAGLALAIAALSLAVTPTPSAAEQPAVVARPRIRVPRPVSEPHPLVVGRTPARRIAPFTAPPEQPLAIISRPPSRVVKSDRIAVGDIATPRTGSGPLPVLPAHLRGKLAYVIVTAELTSGGIDARREDGSPILVLWRDVVGVVARRLPAQLDAVTFLDVVSTAGATVRLVPWTRIRGTPVPDDGEARARALLAHVIAQCPTAALDPATRRFSAGAAAAQLPDADTLHAHDERLA